MQKYAYTQILQIQVLLHHINEVQKITIQYSTYPFFNFFVWCERSNSFRLPVFLMKLGRMSLKSTSAARHLAAVRAHPPAK
jgi:hypothetical protein